MKSHSRPIPIILAIQPEITQKSTSFSQKITKNRKNRHSLVLRFTQMIKREITLTLNSLPPYPTSNTHPSWCYAPGDGVGCWSFWRSGRILGIWQRRHEFDPFCCLTWVQGHSLLTWCQSILLEKLPIFILI